MRRIAESAGAPMRAVATSAVREAQNADVFLSRAREIGVEVEVISGVEEARLIHLGVLQAVPVFDKRLLLCDIGGGSTEVLLGEQGEVLDSRSFKLGAVRLTDRFFPGGGSPSSAAVAECRAFVRSVLKVFEREVDRIGFEVAIGSSGTIEQIARLTARRQRRRSVADVQLHDVHERRSSRACSTRSCRPDRRMPGGGSPGSSRNGPTSWSRGR